MSSLISRTSGLPVEDTEKFLPTGAQDTLALLRAARYDAESALENARKAKVPQKLMAARLAAHGAAMANANAVEAYVQTLRAPAQSLPPVAVGECTIEDVRAQIDELEIKLMGLMIQPATRSEQIERLTTMVMAAAADGTPQAHLLTREKWNSADPSAALREILGAKGDGVALACYLFGDALIEKVGAALPDDRPEQLPKPEKIKAIVDLQSQLHHLGWIEETIIRNTENPPLRRQTALPGPLLGVSGGVTR